MTTIRRLLLAFALLAASAAPASAGSPGHWSRVTATDDSNIFEAAHVRTPDGLLHVAWLRNTPGAPGKLDLLHTPITASGHLGAVSPIAPAWSGMSNPDFSPQAGGLRIFIPGIRSTAAGETQTNLSTATSISGTGWALQTGNVVPDSISTYQSPAGATTLSDGTPIVSGAGALVHRGLSSATPTHVYQQELLGPGCCGYEPDVAVDGLSGASYVAWYSNADAHPHAIYFARVDAATGAPASAAGRAPGAGASQSDQRTAISARPGRAGVFMAYAGGYPFADTVRVWRIGAAKSTILAHAKFADHRNINLATDTKGRVWVMWTRGSRVYARRSNAAATAWGVVVSARAPHGGDTAYKLSGDAQAGGLLDVLASFGSTSGALSTYHSQLRPGLSFAAAPSRPHPGHTVKITFTVRDAGAAVKGALVKVGSHHGKTNSNGRVTLKLGPFKARKRGAATASRSGYAGARLVLVVKRK